MSEERKIKIDLRHVMVEENIDVYTEKDLSKPIGNLIHQKVGAEDIALDDKARELYHNGETELDEREANIIINIISSSNILLYIQQAVVKVINESLK